MQLKKRTVQDDLERKLQKYIDGLEEGSLLDYEVYELKKIVETITNVFQEHIDLKDVVLSSDTFGIDEWQHQERGNLAKNLKNIEFYRHSIKEALSVYIDNKWMWSESLDWLFFDVLLYAEIIATVNHFSMQVLGGKNKGYDRFLDYKKDLSSFTIPIFEPPANRWLTFWFLLIILTGFFWRWDVILVPAIYLIYIYLTSRFDIHKAQKLLEKMFKTYSIVETSKFSWVLLWETLVDDKKNGIVWDMEIYRLAEIRKSSIEAGSRA